jgi:hypothetical protein
MSLAGAARKGCHADGAVAFVLPSASWTTLSLSGPAKQVGFAVFDLLRGDPFVNAVLQVSPTAVMRRPWACPSLCDGLLSLEVCSIPAA